MELDLSFFIEPPELYNQAILEITVLAPLSMVSSQPGTYFRSEIKPTPHMIYGLLENALGWHFEDGIRSDIFKTLQKAAKKKHGQNKDYKDSDWLNRKPTESGSGYFSFLQYHLSIKELAVDNQPETYDDLWSMHLHTKGDSFIGGSRSYDYNLEDLITLSRKKTKGINKQELPPEIIFGDKKDFLTLSLKELQQITKGLIKTTSVKPYFPHYYASPKKRGYIIPRFSYQYTVSCSNMLFRLISEAINDPIGPLYLGSNDGWVDLKLNNYE